MNFLPLQTGEFGYHDPVSVQVILSEDEYMRYPDLHLY